MNLVRKGQPGDLSRVLELVKELAQYEKAAGEVEVTVDEMQIWGFGKEKLFDFFVLEVEGRIVGMALYYFKYSTWKGRCMFLEDIIVTASERGKGYGGRLFEEVLKMAKTLKVKRLEWQVLEWNSPAIGFYKKYRSNFDGEWINCKLNYSELQSL